jgi:hypothetical protein
MRRDAPATRSLIIERELPHWNGVIDCEVLALEPSGFRPEDERAYQGASYGWPRFLAGLERLLSGAP